MPDHDRTDGRPRARRVATWTGALLAVGSAMAMTAYHVATGLDHLDHRVNAIGALIGLTGLALTDYGRNTAPHEQSG